MHITKFRILTFALSVFLLSCEPESEKKKAILWYKSQAQTWNEALPVGNGKIGAMVFGNPAIERIQLNDDSMLPADIGWDEPAGNKNDLETIRTLLFEGNNEKADELFVEKFSRKKVVRSHQTLGDLFIEFGHDSISEYRRALNISEALSTVSYKTNGSLFSQKTFVSQPHNAIIIEITSEASEGLNAKINLSRPQDQGFETVKTRSLSSHQLSMEGEVTQQGGFFDSEPIPILKGVKFETLLQVTNDDGELIQGEGFLELKNVSKAVLYIVSNSSYYFEDFKSQNLKDLAKINETDFKTIQAEHIQDYQDLYSRVDLKINDSQLDSIPTNERIELIKNGQIDTGLETLLFQYGRYLLISSSREGTNPANLQGLWNEHIEAPWNADYHLNINLQMNYWLANLTNLDELNYPLFDYIDRLVENGKITASKNFGCRGSFIPHATDLWAPTWLRAPTAHWGCSLAGGGWLMQHYWQHFLFTEDVDFLRTRAFPAISEVAQFYSDWLIEDPRDGTLISAPSTSPENRFINSKGNAVASCLGSAMDQQVIAEVFENYLRACEILKSDSPLRDKIKQQSKQLRPGFVIGEEGLILEWDRDYEETEPGHRHMSHLYGFHPGISVTKDSKPLVFDAVKKTLQHRLENGGAGTGWSRAWLINCAARLFDGEMAHEHIQLLFKKSIYTNLFDAAPPFQIDGNLGYTAGLTEMLLQSHEANIIRILPALPSQWNEGFIRGIKGRGGLEFNIEWSENELEKVSIHSSFDKSFDLIYKDLIIPLVLKAGETYIYSPNN